MNKWENIEIHEAHRMSLTDLILRLFENEFWLKKADDAGCALTKHKHKRLSECCLKKKKLFRFNRCRMYTIGLWVGGCLTLKCCNWSLTFDLWPKHIIYLTYTSNFRPATFESVLKVSICLVFEIDKH